MPADELSLDQVRRFLKRNRIASLIENNRIFFARCYDRDRGETSRLFVEFAEGVDVVGWQRIRFGAVSADDPCRVRCLRESRCTDMAFFAFHFHDLFRELYPFDEYNAWD